MYLGFSLWLKAMSCAGLLFHSKAIGLQRGQNRGLAALEEVNQHENLRPKLRHRARPLASEKEESVPLLRSLMLRAAAQASQNGRLKRLN